MWETRWYVCADCCFMVDPEYPHRCRIVEDQPSVRPWSPDEAAWNLELGGTS